MAPRAKAAPPKDQAPSGAGPTESGAATPHLFIVWKADGSPAPDKLEKGAAPYLVAFHRGCMRAKAGQHEKALDFFQRAVDLNPDFAEAHCNLGVAFAKLGRRSRALTEFAIAVSLNSAFFLAAANLWMLLRGNELARRLHDAVGSFEPDYDEPHDNLGRHGKRLLTNEQRAKELKTLARNVPLAKYLATNERLTKELETLALTQHHIRSGHGAAIVAEVLERFDLWLTPGVIGRISEEEAKHVEAQQTFGFPERPSDYFHEPGYVDWDEVKRFYSEQKNPDFVFGERPLEQRQNSGLVSDDTVQDSLVPGEPTTPAGAAAQPRPRSALQVPEAGHELTRPAQTPAVEWPAAGWQELRGQGGAKKMHAIVDYLRVKWKPFLDATGAAVTLEILEQKDPGAGTALRRYLERHPMPEGLRFVPHDEVMNILAERPTRLVDVASCHRCTPDMQ